MCPITDTDQKNPRKIMKTEQQKAPKDRRIERTKKFLRTAILDLAIENNGINGITVKDVIEEADVARSSFYVHYADKEELLYDALEWKLGEFMDGFKKKYPAHPTGVRDILEYISQKPTYFMVMLNSVGTIKGYELSQRFFVDFLAAPFSQLKLSVPEDIIRLHITGSFLNLLSWWLKPENNQSIDEMTSYWRELVMPGLINVFGVSSGKEIVDILRQNK